MAPRQRSALGLALALLCALTIVGANAEDAIKLQSVERKVCARTAHEQTPAALSVRRTQYSMHIAATPYADLFGHSVCARD
jgi:hypothetical protein